MVAALYAVLEGPRHVVAQVVEAELVVGAVGDVAAVRLAPPFRRHLGKDLADAEAEEAVHPAHPVRVTAGEVVVDGDDVHAVPGERVQVRRQGGHQRLALTGLHLSDVAQVQRGSAHQLHLVVELAEGPPGRLAHDRERLRQQVVQRLAVGVALLEGVGERAQLCVAELDVVIFERLDVLGDRRQSPDCLALAGTQDLG